LKIYSLTDINIHFQNQARIFFFVKKTATGYLEMRCLASDLTLKNLNLMAKHRLTNTNKATK
jgi:hypothetical protein